MRKSVILIFTFALLMSFVVLKNASAEDKVIDISALSAFLTLSDTPVSYTGSENKCVLVNSGATGLVFSNCSDSAGDITEVLTSSTPYLTGGVTSGSANLDFNETLLNITIDARAGSGGLDGNASSICSSDEVLLGNGTCMSSSLFGGGSGDNVSWNQSGADLLYLPHTIIWDATFNTTFGSLDSDTTYTSLSEFTDDILWTSAFNTTGDSRWSGGSSDGNASSICSTDEVLLGNGTCWSSSVFFDDTTIADTTIGNCSVGNSCGLITYDSELSYTVIWDATFNTTFASLDQTGSGGNASFNQSLTDGLYAGIEWDYNQTTPANTYTDAQDVIFNNSMAAYVDAQNHAGGGGNPFDQSLNISDSPTFVNITSTNRINASEFVAERYLTSPPDGFGFNFYDDGSNIFMNVSQVAGNNYFGISTAGAFTQLYSNPNAGNGYLMYTVSETQGASTEINFYEGGTTHNRLWSSGSVRIGGGESYLCTELTSDVDCNTATTGADLVVQDDIWSGGKILANDWTNVTITESQITDLVHAGGGGNPFDQVVNTTSNISLNGLNIQTDGYFNMTFDEYDVFGEQPAFSLRGVRAESKPSIEFYSYDPFSDQIRGVAWLVAHYNLSNGNIHQHFSIETLDNSTGSPSINSHFEIQYGANVTTPRIRFPGSNVNLITDQNLYFGDTFQAWINHSSTGDLNIKSNADVLINAAQLDMNGGDIDNLDDIFSDASIAVKPITTFDMYTNNQADRALRISDDGSNPTITSTGAGADTVVFLEAVKITNDLNVTSNNITDTDCIIFNSGGKICSG